MNAPLKYGLDDKPPLGALLLYGAQWWVVSLPSVIILGLVVARLHSADLALQTFYLQKLFAVAGAVTAIQALFGHRLPLVVGPAATLLVGLVASLSSGEGAVYTSIFVGGALLALAGLSGALARLRSFFTPRIVAVVLVLIAFTLAPTILRLAFPGPQDTLFHLLFTLGAVFLLVVLNAALPGVWKSLTVIIGMAGGTLVYFYANGFPSPPQAPAGGALPLLLASPELHPGTLLAFLFCFLALLINELGSVESVGQMLKTKDMDARIKRGVGIQGAANMCAGGLGVLGTVDFSVSAGIIAATGCASRYPLVPAGLGLLACAFLPQAILLLSCIPDPVMGALMLYLMSTQLASGLTMLSAEGGVRDFTGGIIVGLPLMIGLLIAFAPAEMLAALPGALRPIAGNGFVMGTLTVLALEHLVFRTRSGG